MKNFLISLFTFIGTTGISAQTQSITVHSQTTGKEEIIDVPESMQSEMDSLYWDWQSKNYITLGENCTMASTNPVVSDSIYMDRLSRIPSIIEMPYNEAVRKFIDMYAVRLRNKVSFMLAATNFYMPIFEEALDLYDLPQELKYLPIIESALNPVAVSRQGATGLWQFMLGTGKIYNALLVADLHTLQRNVQGQLQKPPAVLSVHHHCGKHKIVFDCQFLKCLVVAQSFLLFREGILWKYNITLVLKKQAESVIKNILRNSSE